VSLKREAWPQVLAQNQHTDDQLTTALVHDLSSVWPSLGLLYTVALAAPFHLASIPNMRKIESEMISAINSNSNWSKANTSVITDDQSISHIYLHGHEIAQVADQYVAVRHCGYRTKTTKSRLNAILFEFGFEGDRVYQKDFTWYVFNAAAKASNDMTIDEWHVLSA